jgi:hypothetical protein
MKCEHFFIPSQNNNKSDAGKGENNVGKNNSCFKIP